MSEQVNGTNRDQTVLFHDTIDKYVDKENPILSMDGVNQKILLSLKFMILLNYLLSPCKHLVTV